MYLTITKLFWEWRLTLHNDTIVSLPFVENCIQDLLMYRILIILYTVNSELSSIQAMVEFSCNQQNFQSKSTIL
jgi:hypothetical protein